jgi:ribosomal protein L37AE/L43A
MAIIATNDDSPYGTECNESQYISERHINHSWSCDSCGHRFGTSHHLDFNVPGEAVLLEAKKSA